MDKKPEKLETHVRLEGVLAEMVKERAERASRTIPAEIKRALRVAYKLGVGAE